MNPEPWSKGPCVPETRQRSKRTPLALPHRSPPCPACLAGPRYCYFPLSTFALLLGFLIPVGGTTCGLGDVCRNAPSGRPAHSTPRTSLDTTNLAAVLNLPVP